MTLDFRFGCGNFIVYTERGQEFVHVKVSQYLQHIYDFSSRQREWYSSVYYVISIFQTVSFSTKEYEICKFVKNVEIHTSPNKLNTLHVTLLLT